MPLPRLEPRRTATSPSQSPQRPVRDALFLPGGVLSDGFHRLSAPSEMFFGELIQRRTTRWRQTPPVSRRGAPGNLRKQMNLEFPLRIRCLHSWGSPGPQAPLPGIVHRQCNPTRIDGLDLGSSRVLRPQQLHRDDGRRLSWLCPRLHPTSSIFVFFTGKNKNNNNNKKL